jgi:hypothetical protein
MDSPNRWWPVAVNRLSIEYYNKNVNLGTAFRLHDVL